MNDFAGERLSPRITGLYGSVVLWAKAWLDDHEKEAGYTGSVEKTDESKLYKIYISIFHINKNTHFYYNIKICVKKRNSCVVSMCNEVKPAMSRTKCFEFDLSDTHKVPSVLLRLNKYNLYIVWFCLYLLLSKKRSCEFSFPTHSIRRSTRLRWVHDSWNFTIRSKIRIFRLTEFFGFWSPVL